MNKTLQNHLVERLGMKMPIIDTVIEVYTKKGRSSLWICRSIELSKRESVEAIVQECKKIAHAESIEILYCPESRLVTLAKIAGDWVEVANVHTGYGAAA